MLIKCFCFFGAIFYCAKKNALALAPPPCPYRGACVAGSGQM
jgi:hypothetical protein